MTTSTYHQDLEAAYEAIVSNGNEILQYLRAGKKDAHDFTTDPLDECPASVRAARTLLTNASAKLTQLGTRPQDYLEQLQNGYQHLACVRWLINLNILEHLPIDTSISYQDLAAKAKVSWAQLRSISRMAITNGFLEEDENNHVRHSRVSALFVRDPSYMSWARWMVDYSVPSAYKLADATKQWGATVAKDKTAFNLGMHVDVPFFDHLRQTPEMMTLFAGYMRNVTSNDAWSLSHAVSGFDWASLPAGSKIVDVGGSQGHVSIAIARKFPHLKFVVQDLPETILQARDEMAADETIEDSVKARIEFMEHDFFEPQPVKDADLFFMRMICHDWPDVEANKILSHICASITKPNCRVIIMDTILPAPGTTPVLAEQRLRTRDLTMMEVFNAKERELDDWNQLVQSSGLKVSGVNQPSNSVMGLLTVSRAQWDTPVPAPVVPIVETERAPVLIVGAGISGLLLAQALRKGGVPFRVFERDAAINSRPQGYRLKLSADVAVALKKNLPATAFSAFESSCAVNTIGETDYNALNGHITHSRSGGGLSGTMGLHSSFTVDRRMFRTQLMTGIHDQIEFQKELLSYEVIDGQVRATFVDGSSVVGSFIVGADGLNSVVRKNVVPKLRLADTGAFCVYGKTEMKAQTLCRLPEKALRWMTIATDAAPMLQSCLIGDCPVTLLLEPIRFGEATRRIHGDLPPDYLYWALIGPKGRFVLSPEGEDSMAKKQPAEGKGPQYARALSLSVTEEWHPSIRALFEDQDPNEAALMRVHSSVPDIASWESSQHATVLGDAVHPMSPCGGVGANTALLDAAALAEVLTKGKPSVDSIRQFEDAMRVRAKTSILRSEIGSKKMFGQKNLVDCPVIRG